MSFWYQKSLRRLLVDMHIPDWNEEFMRDFSAENYAEMIALSNADTAGISAGSCLGLCYWPTKIGFRHRIVADGRDLLGEIIKACRKRGLGIQIYLNVWSRAAYDAHPEWRIRFADGSGTVDRGGRFGLCCYNTGFADYFISLLDELNSSYDCNGLWIDMIGNYHVCHCPECRKRFQKETGYVKFPEKIDRNDPCWLALEECRCRWLGEFAARIRETVSHRTQERSVAMQSFRIRFGRDSGANALFLKSPDYLAGDFTGDRMEQSMICKLYSLLSQQRPMEFMTPRCENLLHHNTTRSADNLKMRAFAAIANQCSFTLIDAIDPRGTLDRRFYELARQINTPYAQYEKFISSDTRPVADIGIYYSMESLFDPEPCDIEHATKRTYYINLIKTLQKNHLLFAFVRGNDSKQWDRFPVIFLSDAKALSEAECVALSEYVQRGGRLFITGSPATWDIKTGKLANSRLASLIGADFTGCMTGKISYIKPLEANLMLGITMDYPLMLDAPQAETIPHPGSKVLAKIVLPISQASENVRFGSAISNPPLVQTEFPAMIVNRNVWYLPGKIEDVELDLHRRVLANLLRKVLIKPILETNAPACVECTLFNDPGKRRYIFSLLNLPAELPALPLFDLEFELKVSVTAVKFGMDETNYPFEYCSGVLILKLARLDEFAIFSLEY